LYQSKSGNEWVCVRSCKKGLRKDAKAQKRLLAKGNYFLLAEPPRRDATPKAGKHGTRLTNNPYPKPQAPVFFNLSFYF